VDVAAEHKKIDDYMSGLKCDLLLSLHYDTKRGKIFGAVGIPFYDKNINGSKASLYLQFGVAVNLFPTNAYRKVTK
jgi:hypothetical protein